MTLACVLLALWLSPAAALLVWAWRESRRGREDRQVAVLDSWWELPSFCEGIHGR